MKKDFRQIRIDNINILYQIDMGVFFDEVSDIISDILEKLPVIDEMISTNLTNYTINRLSYYDRAIIRYSIYEVKYLNIPKAIIINEAIEITKIYTDLDDEKQHKFTNRLLDNILKEY
ncbi:MAG: transcription antitermination factor NusB [Acholeplasmataceae bacterium]|jgi:N utilization substance protein B